MVGEGEDLLVQLVDLQRITPVDLHGRAGVYIVGGQAVLTTIGKGDIRRRVVRRWLDSEGRTIVPLARKALPCKASV